jgi:heme exporter protein A
MPAVMLTSAAPLLQAKGLCGRRGERVLFQGLDLRLIPGDVVWLRGRNGRGKTTLLRILAGLSPADAGTLHHDGAPLRRGHPQPRAPLYVAHANALKDDLTAAEALRFLCALGPQGASEAAPGSRSASASTDAVVDALRRLGVASRADAPVRTLSQGQRRRVALARLALAPPGGVWLLDEPYDALDPRGILALDALLAAHADRGGAVLMTSHQAVSLERPVPRIVNLDDFVPAPAP